jgi:hypothetical protein
LDLCEQCVYGKQKRVGFLIRRKGKKSEMLELVHTNVWGRAQVSSLGVSRYYATFIDDATRKNCVYCIRQKYDVFYTFKKWKSLCWMQVRLEIKVIFGGEACKSKKIVGRKSSTCKRGRRSVHAWKT